jgi:hypothetical protein
VASKWPIYVTGFGYDLLEQEQTVYFSDTFKALRLLYDRMSGGGI